MTPDPLDRDEVVDYLDEMRCHGCGGLGVVVDAAPVTGGLWLICWRTEHVANCPGTAVPEIAYTVDLAALARGDAGLPAVPVHRARQCQAIASTTGQRCRNSGGAYGLCGVHKRHAT
jgi:hypothetical protein